MKFQHAVMIFAVAVVVGIYFIVQSEIRARQRKGHPAFVGQQFGFILRDNNGLDGKTTLMLYLDNKGQWHEQYFPTEMVVDVTGLRVPTQQDTLKLQPIY